MLTSRQRGGGSKPALSTDAKDESPVRKTANLKKRITANFTEEDVEREQRELESSLKREGFNDEVLSVAGIPDDIMDKLELVTGDDERATGAAQRGHKQAAYIVQLARGTRAELEKLLLKGVVPTLLRLALDKNDSSAKAWAGELLSSIGGSINKHDNMLRKANAKYAETKKKLSSKSLTAALFPKGRVQRIVQRELRKAERYRNRLLLLGDYASANIPREYWATVKLPEFSPKSVRRWEKYLSPLIMKKIDVEKMPPLKLREYDTIRVSVRDGKLNDEREGEKKTRKRYASDLGIHDHLKLLARLKAERSTY